MEGSQINPTFLQNNPIFKRVAVLTVVFGVFKITGYLLQYIFNHY